MSGEVKKYSNGEITVVWKPSVCIHSTKCWKDGLPEVFDPKMRPWINPQGAESERIRQQVMKCPSGALTIEGAAETDSGTFAAVTFNGPLIVEGNIEISHHNGQKENRSGKTAFCRCGHSANKPYCDGSHHKNKFE